MMIASTIHRHSEGASDEPESRFSPTFWMLRSLARSR